MKNDSLVFWRDVPVLYKAKEPHAYRSSQTKFKESTGFAVFDGEIPVGYINAITGLSEPVVNTRGLAYGARKRLKYRSKKK